MGQEAKIRVLIVDDHRLFRETLCKTLPQENGIKIVGEAWDAKQSILIMADLKPDVALLSTAMQEKDLLELIKFTRLNSPETKVIMLTGIPNENIIFKTINAGAKGYLSNSSGLSDLIKAVKAVQQGELWIERKMLGKFFKGNTNSNFKSSDGYKNEKDLLTPREKEVLSYLVKGLTNKEIGKSLFISEKTVKVHLNHIFQKIHVTSRPEAILYAIRKGLSLCFILQIILSEIFLLT